MTFGRSDAHPASQKSRRIARVAGVGALTGIGLVAYAGVVERNAFTLRRFTVPVLPPGSAPLRVLHVSDLHILQRQRRKIDYVRALAGLQPDLVINTGDMMSSAAAIPAVVHALDPLAGTPGGFVPGNNDYYAPRAKNPWHYIVPERHKITTPPLPWPELAGQLTDRGWLDLTHRKVTIDVGHQRVALAGLDDPHLRRARYAKIAGPADPDAVVRIGVMHTPEPWLIDRFAVDGYDLVLAGHTHGGQVRIPFGPPLVTNCGLDRKRARWLHQWNDSTWLHVCAGLGTGPYAPIRFGCRPEASLLTLVART